MSPVVSRTKRISDLYAEINALQALYDKYRGERQLAIESYDSALDGSQQKFNAIEVMNLTGDKIHAVELSMDKLVDELDSLGGLD